MTALRAAFALLWRDLRLAGRGSADSAIVVVFFVLAAVLFPFGVGPEPNTLARIGPGIIWVVALLSAMLSLERLFLMDYEDGALDLLVLSPTPLEIMVLAKVVAHWLTTGIPLIIAGPILAVLYNVPAEALPILAVSLLLGTPTLSLIGAIGAALTLGARRGGVLLSLLILPLYIPILIFGVAAIDAAISGLPFRPHILILSGLLLAALPLAPWATAAALRQSVA